MYIYVLEADYYRKTSTTESVWNIFGLQLFGTEKRKKRPIAVCFVSR